jgi:hypothetical protein
MKKKREPIDPLVDPHVWFARQAKKRTKPQPAMVGGCPQGTADDLQYVVSPKVLRNLNRKSVALK